MRDPSPLPARRRLLDLLLAEAILHAGPERPILAGDGTPAPWMLDSLQVTLTARGAELAARCLLDLLDRFEGRQLATYGLIGVPLLQSVILRAGGRYRGLLVRKERKPYGAQKRIEGPIDPAEPVVIVDDSIVSGTSMLECAAHLEEAGLRVEGAVCLVRFGYEPGVRALRARGLHVEAVLDLWDDVIPRLPESGLTPPVANPTRLLPGIAWHDERAPDALHPAALARAVLAEALASGRLLRPPARLDRKTYDAAGGVFVSVRSRADPALRYAREGYFRFPGEPAEPAPRGVVLACAKVAAALGPQPEGALERCAIAVTFLGALEPCTVGDLDADRCGIVVRSRERTGVLGGALPRMPAIAGEWRLYEHAARTNAGLAPFEAHDLFRYEVAKVVEPGAAWPRGGAPVRAADEAWRADPERAGRVAARGLALVRARLGGAAARRGRGGGGGRGGGDRRGEARAAALPPSADSVFVTVHEGGRLRGCAGAYLRGPRTLDEDLEAAVGAALADARFADEGAGEDEGEDEGTPLAPADAGGLGVVASILHDAVEIGEARPEDMGPYYRFGVEALEVRQGERRAVLLPSVAATHDLDPTAFALAVADKAGIVRPPYRWVGRECTSWLATGAGRLVRMDGPVPEREAPASRAHLRERLAGYLRRHARADGTFPFRYHPFFDVRSDEGADLPRLAHGAFVLARAGLRGLAGRTARFLERHVAEAEEADSGTLAFDLLASVELAPRDRRRAERARGLAATLWARVDPHGRLATHAVPVEDADAYQDYYPGEALLALARAAEAGIAPADGARLERAFRFYRHRFRYRRDFGPVTWLAQAFAAWHRVLGRAEHAALAFEAADLALEHQLAKPGPLRGAFVNDHQWDTPGFTTALYLEGIGAAGRLAARLRDEPRRRRYREAWERGLGFVDRLVLQDRDRPVLPCPERAIGGVRQSLVQGVVRIDFVQHALAAVLEEPPAAP